MGDSALPAPGYLRGETLAADECDGSGSDSVEARQLGRKNVGIELLPECCIGANERLDLPECELDLLGFSDGNEGCA